MVEVDGTQVTLENLATMMATFFNNCLPIRIYIICYYYFVPL